MRDRMLREMASLPDAMTIEIPLMLVLEDLHWSDAETLDLISWLARRRASARLLLIGTYCPVEVSVSDHFLQVFKQELFMHHLCEEWLLDFLPEAEVAW